MGDIGGGERVADAEWGAGGAGAETLVLAAMRGDTRLMEP